MSGKRKTTRREFILGHSAVEALGDLTHGTAGDAVGGSDSVASSRSRFSTAPTYLIQVSRRAMACEWALFLNAGQHTAAEDSAIKALDLVESLEAQLSVFRDTSEVSALNRRAATEPFEVESRLYALLTRSRELYDLTNGAFDITAGPLSKAWGFFRREGRLPEPAELKRTLECVGGHLLTLDDGRRTIRFERAGVEINLGGIGKGYALDRCTDLMLADGVGDFLIHGGQSSVAARGTRSADAAEPKGWTLGIKHPLRPDVRLAEIYLRDQALSTSGSAMQSFRHQGRRFGHILDPRTGYPAAGVLSATVIAPDATSADALSTAFYVLGVDETFEICHMHAELGVVFVVEGSRSGAIEIFTCGLDDDQWSCLV